MALFDDAGTLQTLQRPNQQNSTGPIDALVLAEYGGMVEGTIARMSALDGLFKRRTVRGTSTVTNYAVGGATLGKVLPGVAPEANTVDFSKASMTIDTVVYARNVMPLLETFQTQYDARSEVAEEHGKELAKFIDQSYFIQLAKAAQQAQSTYSGGTAGKPKGHSGGSVKTLTAAGDRTDPAKLYAAIRDLFVMLEKKDVTPRSDGITLALQPEDFYTLLDAEQIINTNYVTSEGTSQGGFIFKAFGCPVISSNNIPTTNITGHLLSTAGNGNAYNGNFTKLVALAFATRALLAGETIPLTSDVFYDKTYKSWFVDSHLSYGVTPNRAEYAGAIMLP